MTKDLIAAALDERPLEFQQAFSDAVNNRISELVDAKKQELAQAYLVPQVEEPEVQPEVVEEPKE
jgi:hypothetical protein